MDVNVMGTTVEMSAGVRAASIKRRLSDQVECIKREIRMRKRVYPSWVTNGRMSQAKMDFEISCMEAALGTLLILTPVASLIDDPPGGKINLGSDTSSDDLDDPIDEKYTTQHQAVAAE